MSKSTPITEIIFVDQEDIQSSQSCLDPMQPYELVGPPQYHYNAALAQLLALFGPTPAPLLEFTAGPDASTVTVGPINATLGSTIHFHGGTVEFTVTPGSVVIETNVKISADSGNLLSTGTDGALKATETVTNLVLSGMNLEYTDENGTINTINLSALASADTYINNASFNPTTATLLLQDTNGLTPDISIDLSQLRSIITNNGDGTYTHNDGIGNITTIDTRDGVSADAGNSLTIGTDMRPFLSVPAAETTTNISSVVGNQIATYTNEDGVNQAINETITSLTFNQLAQELTYTSENGVAVTIDTTQFVSAADTYIVSATYNPATAELVLIDNNGTTANVSVTLAKPSVTDNADGTYTHDDGSGVLTVIDTREGVSTDGANILINGTDSRPFLSTALLPTSSVINTIAGNKIADHVNENAVITPINETITTVSGTVTGHTVAIYTNESGTAVNVNETITAITNTVAGHKVADFTNENGVTATINETITTVGGTVAGRKIADFTNENGIVTNINETVTTIGSTVAGHKIADYTNENGATTDLNETVISVTNTIAGNKIAEITNEAGVAVDIDESVTSVANVISGHKIADFTNELGVVTNLNETVTTINNAVAGHKVADYTNENGVAVAINETVTAVTNTVAGNKIADYTNENGVVTAINQTTTTVTNTVAGTKIADYTNEAGAVVAINQTNTAIANVIGGHKVADFTNEAGTVTNINETVTALNFNSGAQQLTYTDENGTNTVISTASFGGTGGVSTSPQNYLVNGADGKPFYTIEYTRNNLSTNQTLSNVGTYTNTGLSITIPSFGTYWLRYHAYFENVCFNDNVIFTQNTILHSSVDGNLVLSGDRHLHHTTTSDFGDNEGVSLSGSIRKQCAAGEVINLRYTANNWTTIVASASSEYGCWLEYEKQAAI